MKRIFSERAKSAMRTARLVLLGHHARLSKDHAHVSRAGLAAFLIDAAVLEMLLGGALPEVEDLRTHLRPTCPEVDAVSHKVLELKISTCYSGYVRL